MASLVLSGDTSGSITVSAPAVSGSNTQTLVATTGTLAPIVSATAKASTSGTSVDFTDIPSWVKRITVMLNGVSTSGTSAKVIRIGTGGTPATTGYSSSQTDLGAGVVTATASTYFQLQSAAVAARAESGALTLTLMNSSTNTWVIAGGLAQDTFANTYITYGSKSLSGALDIVRLTTAGGSDTFDAGTVNIIYE